MGLRELLGLPPKRSRASTPEPDTTSAGPQSDPATYAAAIKKCDQVLGHAGFASLSQEQQDALTDARSDADQLNAQARHGDASKHLNDATGLAAKQIVKAQTAQKDYDATAPKIPGVLDGIRLLGVDTAHVQTLQERYNTIAAAADTDIVTAAKDILALAKDLASDPLISAAKAARSVVLSEQSKVEAEGAEALKVEIETPVVQKQNRILADALPNISWNAGKLNFVEAARYIETSKACIALINAEAPGIAAAIKLRDDVLAERKKMDADVQTARLVYGVTEEAKGVISSFKRADQNFEGAILKKDYALAQTYLNSLSSLTKRVIELKPAMEAEEAAQAARNAQVSDIQDEYRAVKKTPTVTSELVRIFALFDAKVDAYFEAYNKKEYDKATALVPEIKALRAEYVEAADDAADELQKDVQAQRIWKKKCRARFAAMKKLNPTLPAMKDAVDQARAAKDEVNAKSTAKDFTATLAAVQRLEGILDTIDELIEDDAAALKVRKAGWAAYKPHTQLCKDALNVKPLTPEMAALYKAFVKAHDEFHNLRKQGDEDAVDLLPDLVAKAQAVLAGKDENQAGEAEAQKAAEDARDAAVPDFRKAKSTAEKYRPVSDKELNALTQVSRNFGWLFQAGRFMEAVEALKALPAAIKAIDDAEPQWKATAAASKKVFDKRVKKLKSDYDKVVAYEHILPGLDAEIANVVKLKADVDSAEGAGKIGEASGILETLEDCVATLISRKGEYDTALADKTWVEAKKASIEADVDSTIDAFALLPETQDIQSRMRYAKDVAKTALTNLNFGEARIQWAELDRLLGEWKSKETDNDDAWTDEAKDVSRRLKAVKAERTQARAIKPITPDLEKLHTEYRDIADRFWQAYRARDWIFAQSLLDKFEPAVKALAAAKPAYDAALLAAQPVADAATRELTDISPADLKSKSTDEKLQLLSDMRATGADLTPAQRKLQRKLYASLDYDPAFKEADEKRRAELVEALKADKEVTEARGKWGGMTDDQRLAVLMKVLNAECRVFNIPPPAVRLYYTPRGEGFFSPGSMTLNLNTHPDSGWSDYKEAVNTVVHENMHNYQAVLGQRLEEGLITPEDPEYAQAMIFAANDAPGGYVAPSEKLDPDEAGTKPYKTQPVEAHAWDSGDGVAEALVAGIAPPKGVKLNDT